MPAAIPNSPLRQGLARLCYCQKQKGIEYASIIQKLQKKLGIDIVSFAQLGDVIYIYQNLCLTAFCQEHIQTHILCCEEIGVSTNKEEFIINGMRNNSTTSKGNIDGIS